ncbi:MAG: hypothetical protein PHQ43_13125 [Dehalococcoidales bacterium]|nr:hypothetical protein [Dehalococcoidales bacterium]
MNNRFVNFWKKLYQDPFKKYLVIALVALGFAIFFTGQGEVTPLPSEGLEVHFFYLPGCSHCEEQEPFNKELAEAYSSIQIIAHNSSEPAGAALLSQMLAELGVDKKPDFPVTIFGERVFGGWVSVEVSGVRIEQALKECLTGNCGATDSEEPGSEITVPILGKIDPSDYSLRGLAVTLGFIDGFNPCAMWVLAYLISLIATLKDRRKIWVIVGSFVFASGVLYFLFMTAWLNIFLVVGYLRPVTIAVGLVALGGGILHIREFIKTKGAIVCEIQGEESRKKTMNRMESIVRSPLTVATIAGIVVLAFVVNSIEFACSAAIPAVFTQILTLNNLTTFQYYSYILLYVFFFMLDDLIIFGGAAFAINSRFGDRYVKYSKPVGGTVLLVLGIIMLFVPNLLR